MHDEANMGSYFFGSSKCQHSFLSGVSGGSDNDVSKVFNSNYDRKELLAETSPRSSQIDHVDAITFPLVYVLFQLEFKVGDIIGASSCT